MSRDHCTLRAGQRVDGFVVERLLGTGGSAQVYQVRDTANARTVALKLLSRAKLARRPELVQAFQREYHRLQLLRHPRIVEVYQYGSDRHGQYYTMELIDGPDLRAAKPLPWREACFVLRDIALSLAIVHSRRLVHRDVGPANVRLGRDGRAKLLDFGASVSMGVPHDIVGTPPCTPPEALESRSLDAGADLFGLGALAYYLLTGQHAYPANTLAELLPLWEAPLVPPSAHSAPIPHALDKLVMSLLQRDCRLRPRSATEVINHLEAVADLAPVPAHEAAQTSFVSPAFVGRASELHWLCCHVEAACRGCGSVLLVEATPGMGRTRLLQQLVIEASQHDVLMLELRAEQVEAPQHLDACDQLCEAVLKRLPDAARRSLENCGHTWSALLDAIRKNARGGPRSLALHAVEARRAAVCDALLELTQHTTVVLLLDDIQAWDDASAALYAALAERAAKHRLMIVATLQRGAHSRVSSATATIARRAHRISLKPLSAPAVEQLVRSAFVDAVQVKFVSDWVASLSEGNPSKIVALLRYLVEHDLVVFRDGAWALPDSIDPALLPRNEAAALRRRVQSLTSSARALATLLAVLVRPASSADLRTLLVDAARATLDPAAAVLGALDELASADLIVVADGSSTNLRPAVREVVLQAMTPLQLQRAHARVGRAYAQRFRGKSYDASVDLTTAYFWAVSAYHLLAGGEQRRGVQLWLNALRYAREVDFVPMADGNAWYADGHMSALAAARALALPSAATAHLRIAVVQSALQPEDEQVISGEELLHELAQACGLRDDPEPAGCSDPAGRITAAVAMERARKRWAATPEAERGIQPDEACDLLRQLSVRLSYSYYHTLEADKVAALPARLTALEPIRPGYRAFSLLIEGIAAYVAGRTQDELDKRLQTLAALDSPSVRAILNETGLLHLRGLVLYTLAALETVRSPSAGRQRIAQLEREMPFMTFGSAQLRLLLSIQECNPVDAQASAERMEVAAVQDANIAKLVLHASGLQPLAAAYAMAGDISGLKSMLDKLEPYAQHTPSWRPFHDAARAHYHMLLGKLELARELAERAAAETTAGKHRGYGFATLARLRIQLALRDDDAAHVTAREALAQTHAQALGPELEAHLCALDALALSRLGDILTARAQGRRAVAIASASGISGLPLAEIHRALARSAILERDAARFERHAALVEKHSCAHHHPVLLARHMRLLAEAVQSGLMCCVERMGSETLRHDAADLREHLLAEVGRSSLARSLSERVLDLMVRRARVSSGFLFEQAGTAAALRLSAPVSAEAPEGLVEALEACLAEERAIGARSRQNTMTATRVSIVHLEDGQRFQVAALQIADDAGALRAAGAIALRVQDTLPSIPRWDCLLALSTVLCEKPEHTAVRSTNAHVYSS